MQQFDVVMEEILEFTDVKATAELQQQIEQVAEKQRHYKSEHKYDLARFGLTEERIRRDYAVIYDTFLNQESVSSPHSTEMA